MCRAGGVDVAGYSGCVIWIGTVFVEKTPWENVLQTVSTVPACRSLLMYHSYSGWPEEIRK